MTVLDWWARHRVQLSKFGTVGVAGVVVDAGVFNLLLWGPMGEPDQRVAAKVIATAVAIVAAWVAHRWWTFRHVRTNRPARELSVFVGVNLIALAIQAAVVWVAVEPLGYTSALSSNIAAYGVGLPLGTIARYVGYTLLVFTGRTPTESHPAAAAESADEV